MLRYKSISVLLIIFFFLPGQAPAQELNYEDIFGDNWRKAEAFERENKNWIEPLIKKNGLSYPLVMSVVFPELVRYSALRDKMEITLLKALYVNLGDEYANFSIGPFQVKPSFASIIRTESAEIPGRKSGIRFNQPDDYDNISNYRKSIVVDLEDPKTEFSYIIAFFRICEKKFGTGKMDEEEKVKFLAAAYNAGIDKTADQIRSMTERKFFSATLLKSVKYCYSDISLYRYRKNEKLQ